MPRPSQTGRHGVRFDAHRQRYKVTVWDPCNNKLVHGGYYADLDAAARRYDELAIEVYGSPGAVPYLNFPRESAAMAADHAKRQAAREAKAARETKAATADGATRDSSG